MNRTMPAVVNYASEAHSVELREVPVPEIGNNDVLLAVQAVGVCGTDIHVAYEKHTGGSINYPVILGHEFGGVIVQAGKDVHGFKEGDRVVSETAAISMRLLLLLTRVCTTWILDGAGTGLARTAQ